MSEQMYKGTRLFYGELLYDIDGDRKPRLPWPHTGLYHASHHRGPCNNETPVAPPTDSLQFQQDPTASISHTERQPKGIRATYRVGVCLKTLIRRCQQIDLHNKKQELPKER